MRYELTDHEWAAIKPMLPNKPRGVPRVNDRRVLNGIFWVLRSGAPWRDLPDAFGSYTTCYNRFVHARQEQTPELKTQPKVCRMDDIEPDKVRAALEQLETEKERRIQAKIDSGEMASVQTVVVVHPDESIEDAQARARWQGTPSRTRMGARFTASFSSSLLASQGTRTTGKKKTVLRKRRRLALPLKSPRIPSRCERAPVLLTANLCAGDYPQRR
jgi:Putative transposase of IS4/5 family (DUF4096)